MKKIISFLPLLFLVVFSSCRKEEALDSKSIFDTTPVNRDAFDQWIQDEYTAPYNIWVNWKYVDKEASMSYNLAPSERQKAAIVLQYIKHVWIGSYDELTGDPNFIRTNTPRIYQLIGSKSYRSADTETLGTAEGGMKITLYNVNGVSVTPEFTDEYMAMLNKYFFHVMFHEFGHILNQKKNYSTDFNLISIAEYKAGDWVNLGDDKAPAEGFITGYASKDHDEDFVEMLSMFVTTTPEKWEQILASAGEKRTLLENKLSIVNDYMLESWGIDIVKLRTIALRRLEEVKTLDIKNFN